LISNRLPKGGGGAFWAPRRTVERDLLKYTPIVPNLDARRPTLDLIRTLKPMYAVGGQFDLDEE
jgi:hypothetical protein